MAVQGLGLHHHRYLPATDRKNVQCPFYCRTSLVAGRTEHHSQLLCLAVGGTALGNTTLPDHQPTHSRLLCIADTTQPSAFSLSHQLHRFRRNLHGNDISCDATYSTSPRTTPYQLTRTRHPHLRYRPNSRSTADQFAALQIEHCHARDYVWCSSPLRRGWHLSILSR